MSELELLLVGGDNESAGVVSPDHLIQQDTSDLVQQDGSSLFLLN